MRCFNLEKKPHNISNQLMAHCLKPWSGVCCGGLERVVVYVILAVVRDDADGPPDT